MFLLLTPVVYSPLLKIAMINLFPAQKMPDFDVHTFKKS